MYRKRFISSHFKTFTRLFVFEDKFITSIITLWVAAILSLNHFLIHNRQDWSEKLNLIELWKKNVWSFFIYFVFKELIVHSFNWSFGRPKHWGKLGIRDNRVESTPCKCITNRLKAKRKVVVPNLQGLSSIVSHKARSGSSFINQNIL